MRVYLAAPYAARDRLRKYADELGRLGHKCTSTWLDETVKVEAGTVGAATEVTDHEAQQHVAKDIRDIRRSDVLVVWTFDKASTLDPFVQARGNSGGRHVETGVALAIGLPVVVIGQPEHIFHRGHGVQTVPDWHEACLLLAEMERTRGVEAVRAS